jgi:hypothetical protein
MKKKKVSKNVSIGRANWLKSKKKKKGEKKEKE